MCLVRANPDNGKKLPENPLKSAGENTQCCGHCSRNGSDCQIGSAIFVKCLINHNAEWASQPPPLPW